ncbi:unnamed protein product [Thlaspi arvense]|uniref:Uncharacterized protein n=1 Tax=Thlaspi arvense TaxID=13288 RepID=A0AAU9R5F5_THLAR|nr:unnamed protein product [Thlaspi arvense]
MYSSRRFRIKSPNTFSASSSWPLSQ